MKKIITFVLSAILLIGSIPAFAQNSVRVTLDGEFLTFDVPAQIINNRTMVPMRGIFESLGATVNWDGETGTASGTLGNVRVEITLGEKVLYRNGVEKELDVPAQVVGERILVPLRAIAQSFGCYVNWDGENSIAVIKSNRPSDDKINEKFDTLVNFILDNGKFEDKNKVYDVAFNLNNNTAEDIDKQLWSYNPETNTISLYTNIISVGMESLVKIDIDNDFSGVYSATGYIVTKPGATVYTFDYTVPAKKVDKDYVAALDNCEVYVNGIDYTSELYNSPEGARLLPLVRQSVGVSTYITANAFDVITNKYNLDVKKTDLGFPATIPE